MYVVIDRFEGEYAIVELPDGKMTDIKINKIPEQAKEGDVLLIDGDSIKLDEKETSRKKVEIEKLMKDMWSV